VIGANKIYESRCCNITDRGLKSIGEILSGCLLLKKLAFDFSEYSVED